MPPARPQQMSDPADKSDDLIAELAKLMAAAPGGNKPVVAPITKPVPLSTAPSAPAPSSTPSPIRIPGLDTGAPKPATPAPAPENRAPATGTIRIPGMDQPAPVSTSAPVSKFDFGKPVAPVSIRQEPLSSLSERLAPQNPSVAPQAAAPSAVRIPSSLTPVSENRSFGDGPALSVAKPAPAPVPPVQAPAAPASDFSFDFGFAQNPPASATPPRPIPQPQVIAPAVVSATAVDPIAALIQADMDQDAPEPAAEEHDDEPMAEVPRQAPQVVTPMMRPAANQATKPTIAPVGSAQS